ncbi:MAG: ATP-binding protein, partial [Saprospiraceae bacterium]
TKLGHIILPVDSRKNIYLICKESIHNAIKYSQASEISMTVRLKDDLLDISIEDNGLGFDINTIHKGNGLNNMEKRAGELGGRFSLISAPFRGTKIEFTYNLIH